MEVKVEIIDRNYEQIKEFCNFNKIEIEDYIVQCVEDDFFTRKYGDLNEKIHKNENKKVETPAVKEEEPKTEKKKVGRPKKTENKVSSVVEPTKETEKKDKIEEIIDNSKGFLIKQEESVDTTDKTLQTKITRIRRTLKTK